MKNKPKERYRKATLVPRPCRPDMEPAIDSLTTSRFLMHYLPAFLFMVPPLLLRSNAAPLELTTPTLRPLGTKIRVTKFLFF